MTKRWLAAAAVLAVAASPLAADAAEQPTDRAEIRAVAVAQRNAPEVARGRAWTVTTFDVVGTISGRTPRTIEVVTAGGELPNGRRQVTSGQPQFHIGKAVRMTVERWRGRYAVVDGPPDLWSRPSAATECANPYCTAGYRWAPATLPAHYLINPNTADVTDEIAHTTAGAARWEDDTSSSMDWTYDGTTATAATSDDGVNVVYWSPIRTIPGCGVYSACTTTYYDGITNFVTGFDVELYDGYTWSTNGATSYDVQTTLIHEFGHALGLDHTTYANQRMNNPGAAYAQYLGTGDLSGVRALYPPVCDDWCLRNSNSGGSAEVVFTYGVDTDKPVTGDWDGNGTTTPGIVRTVNGQLEWHLRNYNSGGSASVTFVYGVAGDIPVTGDWDGNGTTTIGIVRGREWHLRNSNSAGGASITPFEYGAVTDTFITGDWDGNGTTTIGVWRAGEWHLRNTNSGGSASVSFTYGLGTDTPVTGDWDGNGTTTIGIVRLNEWHLRNSNSGGLPSYTAFAYGAAADVKLTGDWDGNGTTTPGIRR